MVGDLGRGQEDTEQILDLPRARPHGEGDGGQSPLLGLVAPDRAFGGTLRFGDPPAQASVLRVEFGRRLGDGVGGEPLLQLAGVLVDSLAGTVGPLGLPGDGAVLTGEDGGGVADPGAER